MIKVINKDTNEVREIKGRNYLQLHVQTTCRMQVHKSKKAYNRRLEKKKCREYMD